jgi:hypothetical protein
MSNDLSSESNFGTLCTRIATRSTRREALLFGQNSKVLEFRKRGNEHVQCSKAQDCKARPRQLSSAPRADPDHRFIQQ